MIRTKGRKVTRPGGMTGASNKGVKVNVPSSKFSYPAFYYSLSAPVCLLDEEGLDAGEQLPGFPVAALDTTACAAFIKESRMKSVNATHFHRKSGLSPRVRSACARRPGAREEYPSQ